MFEALQRDISILSLEAYRGHYTELSRRVLAEGADAMTADIMHSLILTAANTTTQKTK